jgi:hypothetical protein
VINTTAKIIVDHENDTLLHVIIVVSIEVQVRIGNKLLKTIKASAIRASDNSKSGTSIETCLQSKVERYCDHIYKWVRCFVDSITRFLPGIKKHADVSW